MHAEDIPIALWVLLGSMAFILVLVWIGQLRMRSRLLRLEERLVAAASQQPDPAAELQEQKATNKEQKRLFQVFLDEDPQRALLPKKEQFAAFRKWRSEQGLNWGGGDS